MTQILIVDDNEQNLYMLQILLQGHGYEVRSARNGIEALDMARRQAPDLIITDILMPGMDGFSLCREWMADEKLKCVPLVFYTATYTDPKDEAFALSLGAAKFIVKPTEPDAFGEILRQVLENHATQQLVSPGSPGQTVEVYYQQYNQALIRKLESKMAQLEEANRSLELDIVARKRAEDTLKSLYDASRVLSSSLDEESVIRTILEAVYRTLGCEHVLLSTVDEQARTIGIRHGIWNNQFDVLPAWIEMSQYELDAPDILTDIVRTGKTEIIGAWDSRFNRAIWDRFGHERFLRIFMPLKMQNRVLGVVEVAYDKQAKPAIERDDIETLMAFMDQAAAALENVHLFVETSRRAARLQATFEIDQAILAAHAPQEIAQVALSHVRRLVPGAAGYIALFEKAAAGAAHPQELVVFVTDADRITPIQAGSRFAVRGAAEFQSLLRGELITDTDLSLKLDLPPVLSALQAASFVAYAAAPLRIQGELIGILVVVSDRVQRFTAEHREILREVSNQVAVAVHSARTEAARQAESERLRALINNLPEGVLLLGRDNQIVLSNPVGDTMLGWLGIAPDEPLTHLGSYPLADILGADLASPLMLVVDEPLKNLEVAAYAVESSAAESRGTLVLLRDVTELRQVQELARQRDRLAAVGRLAGGVAHDFNNILTAIIGYTDFVRSSLCSDDPLDWPPGAELRADLEQVSLAAGRASALTRQLLIFSRKEAIKPRVFDLNTLVSSMSKMLVPLIGEDIHLMLHTTKGDESVRADPGQIEQVVMNLAVNARDAMPRGGQLIIETGHVEWDTSHRLSHSQAEAGAYVQLTVRDTGVGMSKQVLSHLFEPFFTTKAPGKGTGLGLATVYGIVQQNNGHVHVQSEPGQGTVFDIYLPHVAEQIHAVARGQRAETEPGSADERYPADKLRPADLVHPADELHPKETILLVEDEDNVRELSRRALERYGYTVLAARGPAEALLLSERYQAVIDLLLSDVVMPEMSGQELAAQIAAQRAGIKVLFMSGYTGDVMERYDIRPASNQAMPALNLLQKPFEARDLIMRVRQTLGEPGRASPASAAFAVPVSTAAPRLPETAARPPDTLQELRHGEQLCLIYSNEAERRTTMQTEAAIRQSELKLRSFIEQADDAIVLTDEQGLIVEWNHGAERVYDIERARAVGRPLWDVQYPAAFEGRRTPESDQSFKKAIQDALAAGWSPLLNALREVEIVHSDGTRRVIQTMIFAIQTDHGFILASISRDITGQKRAQESLIKSEARYRSLIEHLPAIIYETPFTSATGESGASFYVGPQIERLLGFGQKEWAGSSKLWLRQIHPDDRARVLTMLSDSHERGEPFSAEYRLVSRDGRPIWFYDEAVVVRDDKGTPLFLHGVMLEINARKQAEENLRRYAAHLALLNKLGQQIAAELDLDGVLTQAASLIQQSFGYHHVALFILDREQDELLLRADAGLYGNLFSSRQSLKVGQGMIGWAARHGKRLLANDVRREPRYINPYPELVATQSELDVPIRTGGELVGVLDVQSPDLDAFGEDDILVLETLADQIAVAIKNARLYAALAQERANGRSRF